jgi:hypothetical protein
MAQIGAGKHDQWQGNMTVIVVNHGIKKSISIFTVVIRLTRNVNVDKPCVYFGQEVKGMLAIRPQLSTLYVLHLGSHTVPSTRSATGKRYLFTAR